MGLCEESLSVLFLVQDEIVWCKICKKKDVMMGFFLFCFNAALGGDKPVYFLSWSQARMNAEDCVSKGIRCKTYTKLTICITRPLLSQKSVVIFQLIDLKFTLS